MQMHVPLLSIMLATICHRLEVKRVSHCHIHPSGREEQGQCPVHQALVDYGIAHSWTSGLQGFQDAPAGKQM